jgi:multiple sugar transport system permease protein
MFDSAAAKWFRRVTLALITAFALFPVFIILETTVKPLVDVQNTFEWIPSHITFAPYAQIWSTIPLLHYFLDSVIVSVISTAVAVLSAAGGCSPWPCCRRRCSRGSCSCSRCT